LKQGDIEFLDAPEPVLAFRRDLAQKAGVVAVFNLGLNAVQFDLPQAAGAVDLIGHGLAGSNQGGMISLPPFGAWYGTV